MIDQLKRIYEETKMNHRAELTLSMEGRDYIRIFRPRERLILLGAGHVAQPVAKIASMLEFSIHVVDDRREFACEERFPQADAIYAMDFVKAIEELEIGPEDYVLLMTRAHSYDKECLRKILSGRQPFYLGMLGSKKRSRALFKELEEEGYSRELLDSIHSPIGLAIGALSIQEIAVSIHAELIQCRRNKVSSDRRNVLKEDLFEEKLLQKIIDKKCPQVFALVMETSGSTPVKSGAFMTVDAQGEILGTIGGGYAENVILKEAVSMVGSGIRKSMEVTMTNPLAQEEGMMCGGSMKLLLVDL